MSFGLKKGQKKPNQEGGKIQGPGTGTSDDVQKTVPSGSYIMPKDSTDAIGEENLERLGKPTDVNLSNGEFQLTPDQVHQVGVQTLDQMKGQTHTQVNQPQVGYGINKKPELFFANGGLVSSYPSADEVRKAQQARLGGPQIRDVTPEQRQLPATRTPAPQPQTATPTTTTTAPASGQGFGVRASNLAKGLGKFHGVGSMIGGAVEGFNTSTEDYAERMGLDRNAERGPLAETAIRTAGVLSDVGNAASFGILGNRFPDKQRAAAEQGVADQQARYAAHNAAKKIPAATPDAPAQPSYNDQVNSQLYGTPDAQPTQAVPQQKTDPYAIQQKGNSFSYSNPAAANQARAQGVPELQSSGFAGGIRPANDPNGVRNFMANTREMGASQEQINQALNQALNNQQQGFGVRYPDRPVRTAEQEAQLQAEIARVSAPIAGSKGLTASQRNQINDLQMGYANRDVQMYNTDANNATSQLNNATNNTSAIAQTMMREQGSNDRAVLGENGQNSRYGMGLEQDAAKFNAEFGLKKREAKLNETKEGFGIRNSQRVEKLYEMYDKAETDEQRATIQERINRFTGAKGESGKDRYMTVGGGQEYNKEEGVMINRPQQIFDTKTGQLQNIDGNSSRQAAPGANSDKFKGYQVYTDANGSSAYFDPETGQFRPIPK